MSYGSPRPSSFDKEPRSGRRRSRPNLFDVVRVRRPVPEYGIKAGDQGTVVEVFTNPEGYLVDFSYEPGYDDHKLPVYSLTADQLEVVRQASPPAST
jgi:hypothetical protein